MNVKELALGLSRSEKLSLMEALWIDLSSEPETMNSPQWHELELQKTESSLAQGLESVFTWEEAQKQLRSITGDSFIAERSLRAIWPDGSSHDVSIKIGKPYPFRKSFCCTVEAKGLIQDYSPPFVSGFDEVQALTLSLTFVRSLLEWHIEAGGSLFYPDSDDVYIPDDLPEMA